MRIYNTYAFVVFVLLMVGLSHPSFAIGNGDGEDTLPTPIAGQPYHLVKDWDFSKTILNTDDLRNEFYTRYASNGGTLDHLHEEWEVYRDNNNHVISGGVLHLVARDPSGVLEAGSIESGMIRSKWETRYGYFEAKMKVPRGRGMWPAFWFSAIHWPPEIDALEIVSNDLDNTKGSFHGVHGKYIGKTVFSLLDKYNVYRPGFDYADGFHVFAIEWTPTTVKHYVDNVLVVEREFEWRHDDGMEGDPTPVVVNLAVGGTWPGPPKDLSEFPASLDVAYIRVWQKD